MGFLKCNIGRRQFISVSSMVLGAGMLSKPSNLLFAANGPLQAATGVKSDGTKYGKCITLAVNNEPTERGINMFPMEVDFPGFSTFISGRMPPPGPMPGHAAPEKHNGEIEYLIHLKCFVGMLLQRQIVATLIYLSQIFILVLIPTKVQPKTHGV